MSTQLPDWVGTVFSISGELIPGASALYTGITAKAATSTVLNTAPAVH